MDSRLDLPGRRATARLLLAALLATTAACAHDFSFLEGDAGPGSTADARRDGAPAPAAWDDLGTLECAPGQRIRVGCNAACGVGRCTGDPVLRACDGESSAADCARAGALGENDDACDTLCASLDTVCPASGSVRVIARGYNGRAFTCDPAIRASAGDAGAAPDGGCVPRCGARVCGPDGCGGTCGACGPDAACSRTGQCVPCTRNCEGRTCGDDGCGGSCGACPSGQICGDTGACVCDPACGSRNCGPDACGGSCGTCPSGSTCQAAGVCSCTPRCAGRECGANGCGGSCGACPSGQSCNSSGQCVCVPNCAGRTCGANGCGGSCGTCASGSACNTSGQCVSTTPTPSPTTGTQVASCLTGLSRVAASSASWHDFPAPFSGLDYKVYWSSFFSVYEVIFRNRYTNTIHFSYAARGGSTPTVTTNRRSMSAGAVNSPPGITVSGAVDGGRACILVDRVRFGASDTGPYR